MLTLTDAVLDHNVVTGSGGAIFIEPGGTATISDSTFNDNEAALEGGAINNRAGTLIVYHSTFFNNQSGKRGGAIHSLSGVPDADLTVGHSIFSGNTAGPVAPSDGGAISNRSATGGGTATATVTDSIIVGNTADDDGGGVNNEAGAAGGVLATMTIIDSIVAGNSASAFGADINTEKTAGTGVDILSVTNTVFDVCENTNGVGACP
ncbi:MAG: hypothetical protein O6909_02705 [Alphaproteobacteria bacterium]|nr:hypothetical protein [Alphaproteobacteria bacterium]